MFRAIIVDDEAPARHRLEELFANIHDFEVSASCCNGFEAIQAIETLQPDVVFLDICMPGMDGFELISRLPTQNLPALVFVTAFNTHAVQAFERHAVDYLLKPFNESRFRETLKRVRQRLRQSVLSRRQLGELADQMAASGDDRLPVRLEGRIVLVPLEEIQWVEAQGNYVRIHCRERTYFQRASLASLLEKLEKHGFVRIHQSRLVRLKAIQELRLLSHGQVEVRLKGGQHLTASRRHSGKLKDRLGL